MADMTIDAFKSTLDTLICSNPHARNKGDDFKEWCRNNFGCDARISHVKEQRQITNRVSEQFRYFAPIVVFVCVPEVKRDTLIEYIMQRGYDNLENVAIIGVNTTEEGNRVYAFEELLVFKKTPFTEWAISFFQKITDANAKKSVAEGVGEDGKVVERIKGGENIILYGVPGAGKSWTIKNEYCSDETCMERLVFHPDYTYSDFVGQIMPKVTSEGTVSYEFSPGPFAKLVKKAYAHPDKMFYLVIEEVNRGNAPAIFGDVFQLLDRQGQLIKNRITGQLEDNPNYGASEYEITNADVARVVYGDENHKVSIPSNMSILCTMNTSDQNVFTLDTAFQRRWSMRLIKNQFPEDGSEKEFAETHILDTTVTWERFFTVINDLILNKNIRMTSAEDKRLGTHFVSQEDLLIDTYNGEDKELVKKAHRQNRRFAEKVLKYLWDDAFKFNKDEVFDITKVNSLEKVISIFVANTGNARFEGIFKQNIVDALTIKP